jgi:D-alanine-D-alanine ligase-like ATP-grasp enzyme
LKDYLNKNKINGEETMNGIIKQIKEIVSIAFRSVRNKLNHQSRQYEFEIFGFDFMIDELFKVWLIEINTNPCIELSSPLL